MPFQIIRNDITRVRADAIVNTANPKPVFAAGTDAAIYKAAGTDALLAERKQIGEMKAGEVNVTEAYRLKAKYIIHTVGPMWIDGKHGELGTLSSCYRKSLHMAEKLGCRSIAFPLISTGVYGFPKDQALNIALAEIRSFLEHSDMDVTLVVFNREAYQISTGLALSVRQYIDDNYCAEKAVLADRRRGNRLQEARWQEERLQEIRGQEEYRKEERRQEIRGQEEYRKEARRQVDDTQESWRVEDNASYSLPYEPLASEADAETIAVSGVKPSERQDAVSDAESGILSGVNPSVSSQVRPSMPPASKLSEARLQAIKPSTVTPSAAKPPVSEPAAGKPPAAETAARPQAIKPSTVTPSAAKPPAPKPSAAKPPAADNAAGGVKKAESGKFSWDAVFGKPLAPKSQKKTLQDVISHAEEGFQQKFLHLMDEKGMKGPDVYRKANLDKKLFSKIKTNPNYMPKKQTAMALTIALKLNMDEAADLLARAGLAFSPSEKFDLIVQYCIENRIYDVYEVNSLLFDYDQPLLGSS